MRWEAQAFAHNRPRRNLLCHLRPSQWTAAPEDMEKGFRREMLSERASVEDNRGKIWQAD